MNSFFFSRSSQIASASMLCFHDEDFGLWYFIWIPTLALSKTCFSSCFSMEKPSGLCKKETKPITSSPLANSSSFSSSSPAPLSKKLKEDHRHVCEYPIMLIQGAVQCDMCGHVVHKWPRLHYDFKVCKNCYNFEGFTDDIVPMSRSWS